MTLIRSYIYFFPRFWLNKLKNNYEFLLSLILAYADTGEAESSFTEKLFPNKDQKYRVSNAQPSDVMTCITFKVTSIPSLLIQ